VSVDDGLPFELAVVVQQMRAAGLVVQVYAAGSEAPNWWRYQRAWALGIPRRLSPAKRRALDGSIAWIEIDKRTYAVAPADEGEFVCGMARGHAVEMVSGVEEYAPTFSRRHTAARQQLFHALDLLRDRLPPRARLASEGLLGLDVVTLRAITLRAILVDADDKKRMSR